MSTSENLSEEEKKQRLIIAAERLYDDYVNDPELTVVTTLLWHQKPFITDYIGKNMNRNKNTFHPSPFRLSPFHHKNSFRLSTLKYPF